MSAGLRELLCYQPASREQASRKAMTATIYEPIQVYKPVASNIGAVDGPIEYLTSAGVRMPMPFTTRISGP
jgi:hypothetical protein